MQRRELLVYQPNFRCCGVQLGDSECQRVISSRAASHGRAQVREADVELVAIRAKSSTGSIPVRSERCAGGIVRVAMRKGRDETMDIARAYLGLDAMCVGARARARNEQRGYGGGTNPADDASCS